MSVGNKAKHKHTKKLFLEKEKMTKCMCFKIINDIFGDDMRGSVVDL